MNELGIIILVIWAVMIKEVLGWWQPKAEKSPERRLGHTLHTYTTWSQEDMNSLCKNGTCGPYCNTSNSICSSISKRTGVPELGNDWGFEDLSGKCSQECCNQEACFRIMNKNGDYVGYPSEEVLIAFGGKIASANDDQGKFCASSFESICFSNASNQLWFFYMEQKRWSQAVWVEGASASPSPRYGHASVIVEAEISGGAKRKYLYVYGGASSMCNNICDDMWKYEIPFAAQRYYSSESNSNRGNNWQVVKNVDSASPGKRVFHSMIVDSTQENIYLFGGMCQKNISNLEDANDL